MSATDNLDPARQVLVDLLREAATLEHCLLNTYLFAACSIKSTPGELELIGGKPNRRRGIYFERARFWKKSILEVAQGEMLHLHYVQCMLRTLGESPCFDLPGRDKTTGEWVIPAWKAKIGTRDANQGKGLNIPLQVFSSPGVDRFVLYESTDSVQDANLYGPEVVALFDELAHTELELYFETALYKITDDTERQDMKRRLMDFYENLSPVEPDLNVKVVEVVEKISLPPVEEITFQSIGDLYLKGILPLYQQAFDFEWVKNQNRDLADELLDPNYAQEGFLPIGPVYRSKNFEANSQNPLKNYKSVESVIHEIVDEGEGFSFFIPRAKAFLGKLKEMGTRAFITAVKENSNEEWLTQAQILRNSHLYHFITIGGEMRREQKLAQQSQVEFDVSRDKISTEHPAMNNLAAEIPDFFNAAYLVLVMWLSRIYEVQDWKSDTPRRKAIEMIASWPMMSLAIRPFLELASFFNADLTKLFRIDREGLPVAPIHALELMTIYTNRERSAKINEQMDYLAMKVLTQVAEWAKDKLTAIAAMETGFPKQKLVTRRLEGLSRLDEFEKQFPFRMYGGYSSTLPSLYYQDTVPKAAQFEEDPTLPGNGTPQPLFENTLVVKLSFAGAGLVQLSTDPDPPTDESGCSGTHMLHPDDGNKVLNRALVWQHTDPDTIISRAPANELPQLGVNGISVQLLTTVQAFAGFRPIGTMSSTGAVQAQGVQQYLALTGVEDLLTLEGADSVARSLQVELKDKDGVKPVLVGDNHLIWKDGEPIDPFVLAISAAGAELFRREIYNEGLTLRAMNPVQRINTQRWPVGFDSTKNLPAWAKVGLTERQKKAIEATNFPESYLDDRCEVLATLLSQKLVGGGEVSQAYIDGVASTVERMKNVSSPRGTTSAWLKFLLNYGHTISGKQQIATGGPLFDAIEDRTGLKLSVPGAQDRKKPNGRWLIKYTKGLMDTDALADFVFGELYIPVCAEVLQSPVRLQKAWSFAAGIGGALERFACRFEDPFWGSYDVSGNERSCKLPGEVLLKETLTEQTATEYSYKMEGLKDVQLFTGHLSINSETEKAGVLYEVRFVGATEEAIVLACNYFATVVGQMDQALMKKFSPGG